MSAEKRCATVGNAETRELRHLPTSDKGSFHRFLFHLHPRLVPRKSTRLTYTFCLGGLALWMFVIETVTGILLALYYVPHGSQAYASVQNITHVVPYGFFIRNIHFWAGQIMVVLVILHMIRVFVVGAYTAPRQMNWLIGLGLLIATVLVDFTGYLVVWDDRALWAWTIARNLIETTPLVGPFLASLALGPDTITDYTMVRLYVWHVLFIPTAMVLLMAWHFWRIRTDGGISVPL